MVSTICHTLTKVIAKKLNVDVGIKPRRRKGEYNHKISQVSMCYGGSGYREARVIRSKNGKKEDRSMVC